jgi:hypothetical protein
MSDENKSAFINNDDFYDKQTNAVPAPEKNVGIDINDQLLKNIIGAVQNSVFNGAEIESFSRIADTRDQVYTLIDTMSQDPMVAAVLETYAEDATEYSDEGRIVWSESPDPNINKYITYLLDTINVDKNIYKWCHSLCKYGDLYLKLYRESETKDVLFDDKKKKKNLNEKINIKAYSENDSYTHYVEMIPNPAEVFELTKFGKTSGFIKANAVSNASITSDGIQNPVYNYKFKKQDIDVYAATEFVHACLQDNSSRVPETVSIVLDGTSDEGEQTDYNYTVRRGQSLLYNVFKIWRELMLLENSVLLNRITKSSIVRLINVEVGDMPKESVGPHLLGIKQMMEQKAAINTGSSLSEYTNPGPIENNIYVPTHDGIGAISSEQIGGDVDVKSLADLEYFKNQFFGALRVPKQYFGDTDDSTGFNGGTSLSIISSRYAKMIKRIQNTLIQAITDCINLMLIDKGLDSYINKFTIKMLPPTTQEELDRRDNLSSKIQIVSDIMNLVGDIDDNSIKLHILSALLSNSINNQEVIDLINEYIDNEQASKEEEHEPEEDIDVTFENEPDNEPFSPPSSYEPTSSEITEPEEEEPETELPSPSELGVDFSNNTNF